MGYPYYRIEIITTENLTKKSSMLKKAIIKANFMTSKKHSLRRLA